MKPYIYIRTLKHAEHTVFCVQEGQKAYFDPYLTGWCLIQAGSK